MRCEHGIVPITDCYVCVSPKRGEEMTDYHELPEVPRCLPDALRYVPNKDYRIDPGVLRRICVERYRDDGRNLRVRTQYSNMVEVGDLAGAWAGKTGYRRILIHKHAYREHRLLWFLRTGEWPEGEIDHINGIRDDNRQDNLRVVQRVGNNRNKALNANNETGVSGVRQTKHGTWSAQIYTNGRRVSLGNFSCFEHAVIARKAAEKALSYHANHARPLLTLGETR